MINRVRARISNGAKSGIRSFLFGQSPRYYTLLIIVAFLVVVGLIMVLSSSAIDSIKAGNSGFAIFISQGRSALLGIFAMVLAALVPFDFLRKQIPWLFVGSIILQLLTITFLGHSVNGNKNWINLGFINLQPSEIIKLTMILYLAEFLTNRDRELSFTKTWMQPFGVSLAAIITVLGGRDLGTAMVMVAILVGVLTFAGLPRVWFWRITGFLAVGIWIALQQGGSRMGRIMAWLHPDWPDPNQYNWQQDHAMWAFASGGWTGVGLGKSQLKWSWIPEAENDFIFAIIGEEGGLIFSIFIVALFVWLTYTLLFAAENNSDSFSRYLIQGVMIWIAVQSTINIAVVLDWLPVLGVPLPLISAGGSSLVMLLAAFGLVLGAERQYGGSAQRRIR
ncbi:MAG: putative lipid II flippase FtsW [Rhodoluna sp.]|nr:putative lipid II flippase FtsW [Rhodoluna sp.]